MQPRTIFDQFNLSPAQPSGMTPMGGMANIKPLGMVNTDITTPEGVLNVYGGRSTNRMQQQTGMEQTPSLTGENAPQQEELWKKMLPTIGSVALPLAGLALAPVTGGGSLLAAAALSGIGAGAGKVAQNVLTDKDALEGVGKEAVTSGALSLAGGAALKGAGKAVTALKPQFQKGAAKIFAGQVPVDPETASYFTKMGIASPAKAGKVSSTMTGGARIGEEQGTALLTQQVENNLGTAFKKGLVKKTNISSLYSNPENTQLAKVGRKVSPGTVTEDAITSNSLSNTNEATAIRKNVSSIFDKYINPSPAGFKADITGGIDPVDGLKAQREIAALRAQAKADYLKTKSPIDRNVYNTYDKINQSLLEQLQLNKIPVPKADHLRFAEDLKAALVAIDKKAGTKIANDFKKIKNPTIQDYRNYESKFVELKLAQEKVAEAGKKTFGVKLPEVIGAGAGFAAGGPVGAGIGYGITKAVESPAAATAATGVLNRLAGVSPKTLNALTRTGAIAGGAGTTLSRMPAAAITPFGGGESDMQQQGMQGQAPGAMGPNPFLSYVGGSPAYLQPQATTALLGMFAPQLLGNAPMAQAGEAAKTQQILQAAAAQLPELMQLYEAAGGAQGGILGRLRGGLGAITGGPEATYSDQAKALQTALAGTPQAPGPIPTATLPQITQTGPAAQGALNQLLAALQAYGVNPQVPPIAQ